MIIYRAKKAGFCFGVKRAIELALRTAQQSSKPIYSLGPLIHNTQVVNSLAQKGIKTIDSLEQAQAGGTLLIRSHGESRNVLEAAQVQGLQIVDATCPFVQKAQNTAAQMWAQGKKVIIFGNKEHPEVKGILSWTNNQAVVIKNQAEAEQLELNQEPTGLLAQTTQVLAKFQAIAKIIKQKTSDLEIVNTICHATAKRQEAAVELAKHVEAMVVIGDPQSANTAKLTELCKGTGTTTYQVETADNINPLKLAGVRIIGITAGASTPQQIIEAVERRMKELDKKMTEENMVNQTDAANEAEVSMTDEAMDVKSVRSGEVVKGTVVQITSDGLLVDIGAKSEGFIPLKELASFSVDDPRQIVAEGQEIEVYVLKAEDSEGRIILSKQRADSAKMWESLQDKLDNQETVEGEVKEVVKGGLLVDIGIRAFMPASLVDRRYVEDLNVYLGQKLQAKIIELKQMKDSPRKKVVLSRKALLEEEYLKKREEMLATIEEGSGVKGGVRRITNFGAFVDIGGIDGLLHISEMSWYRINHPSEVVNVGDEIEVKILKVDQENEKISLGLKQVLPNPWDNVDENYQTGSIITAKVVRLAPFGAFVQLEPGVEGLVHISHLADHHVEKPEEVVSEGEEIQVKVLSVDKEQKRIRLSIREVNKEREPRQKPEPKPVPENDIPEVANDNSNLTIGDMLGEQLKSLVKED
ncbi:MAG: bifunctional 4-hydroxy-3-methylbut-2-enyl diphosphate reductase/30S ribosomal protein S1 [Clostridia bacterium]|nr:bifunctional 4-hydroxy-3-methylbut-2-enyl diphosphate reductase/30S ribosomal protein S1 [Clostridia bacterium]